MLIFEIITKSKFIFSFHPLILHFFINYFDFKNFNHQIQRSTHLLFSNELATIQLA